jgi:hypothetical protein
MDSALVGALGQYYDCLQSESSSVGEIFGQSDEELVQLFRKIGDDSESDACERSEQQSGGQFISNEQVGGLFFGPSGVGSSLESDEGEVILRSVCLVEESETFDLLYPVGEGQQGSSEGRILDSVGGSGSVSSSSSNPLDIEVPEESTAGEARGDSGGSILVGSAMDTVGEVDDEENTDSRRVEGDSNTREIDDSKSGQITARKARNVLTGRKNDQGEQLVLDLLANVGADSISEWFFGSLAKTTLRNYRRGYTLFSNLLLELGMDSVDIVNPGVALSALMRALNLAFNKKLMLASIRNMKTAVVRLFSFMFNADFKTLPMVRMGLRFYTLSNLPRKRPYLNLKWNVVQLLSYVSQLPVFAKMSFNTLTDVVTLLCIAFTAVRFTEMFDWDLFETVPEIDSGMWEMWTHVKKQDCLSPVTLRNVYDEHLDAMKGLMELKSRIVRLIREPHTWWWKQEVASYRPLVYDEFRKGPARIMAAAGIKDTHGYHVKHASMTGLLNEGAPMYEVTAFARHKFGSMAAYEHYISYDGGKKSVDRLMEMVRKK